MLRHTLAHTLTLVTQLQHLPPNFALKTKFDFRCNSNLLTFKIELIFFFGFLATLHSNKIIVIVEKKK